MHLHIKGEKKKKRTGEWFLLALSIIILSISGVFFAYTQYPNFFQLTVNIEKSENISPKQEIAVIFSQPVIPKYLGWKIEIYPQIDFDYRLENNNKRLIITPKKYWNLENEYSINIFGRNYFLSSFDSTINFKTVPYPKLAEFYPAQDAEDVLLDIEDPIRATFDGPINDFNIKFAVSPFSELDYTADSENNQVKLMPKSDLERGAKYVIDVHVRYKEESNGEYRKIGSVSFETKPIPPAEWDKDFSARLEQAKRFTKCLIENGKYIDINLKSQIMTIFENGDLLDAYLISSGKRGMDTREGTFAISNKTPRAWSKDYGLFMPYWMALVPSGEFGIHELPEWPGGYKEGQNHLGTPVSHGCVRLGIDSAERVYSFADIGTPVITHY
jgi:hypothetical protein